jgi:hypothetical protein
MNEEGMCTWCIDMPLEIEDFLGFNYGTFPDDVLAAFAKDLLSPEDTERKKLALQWLKLFAEALPKEYPIK